MRVKFAHDVCKLIYKEMHGDFEKTIYYVKPFYNHFDENVRNIYELIDSHIPLFYLYELLTVKPEMMDLTQEEWVENLKMTKKACKEYYK